MRCMLSDTSLFRRIELQMLMNLTARALGEKPQRIWTMTNDKALQAYAGYTASRLHAGADEALLRRMNDKAYGMGRWLRRLFLIRKAATAQRLLVSLYRNIGIDLDIVDAEHFCFRRCHFSRYYQPAVCQAASALDNGIIRGLLNQPVSQLCFIQRITDGHACCKATFTQPTKQL